MSLQYHNRTLDLKLATMEVSLRPMTRQLLKGDPLNQCVNGRAQCKRAEMRGAFVLADILEAGYFPVYISRSTDKNSDEEVMEIAQERASGGKVHLLKGETLMGSKDIDSPDYYFANLNVKPQ